MKFLNRLSPAALTMTGLAVAAVFLLSLNVLSGLAFKRVRLDLTEHKLYTLAEGTKQVLAGIKEPVTLRFYYTTELGDRSPPIGNYARRVREMLEQYAALSHGRLQLDILHPEPFSDEEDRAVQAGLQAVPMTASGDNAYFGLEGRNSTDDKETVAFFRPERERFLEYDLTRMIHSLANPQRKVVGLISGVPMGEQNSPQGKMPGWRVYEQIKELFEIKQMPRSFDTIDPKIDALWIVHPKLLDDHALYAIDQYVLHGGKALVFVDPFSEFEGAQQRSPGSPAPLANSEIYLEKLFTAWGISVEPGQIAADRRNAVRVDVGQGQRGSLTEYVAWMNLRRPSLAGDDVVTSELDTLAFGTAGIIKPLRAPERADGQAPGKAGEQAAEETPRATAEFKPLAWTSPDAMRIDVNEVRYRPDPVKLLNNFKPDNKPFVLAARLGGTPQSAFPDGPPPSEAQAKAAPTGRQQTAEEKAEAAKAEARLAEKQAKLKAEHLAKAAQPINVIVVADTDMMTDPFWLSVQGYNNDQSVVPVADNGSFVTNAMENLVGSSSLIGLRGRGTSLRPFDTVEDLQRQAEQKFRSKEQALAQKLREAQEKVEQLEGQTKSSDELPSGKVLTTEQRATIDKFRAEMMQTRRELRQVQHELRGDIERLDIVAKLVNIVAIPVVIAILAVVLAFGRRIRRARRAALVN